MKRLFTAILLAMFLSSCGYGNLDHVKDHAKEKWNKQGFDVVDYEGFQWGFWIGNYGGAKVWHRLRRQPDNGITYSGMLKRWGDEIHAYGPDAHDAIKP